MTSGLVILLPPSEGKTESSKGPKLDLAKLSFPPLKSVRSKLIAELVDISKNQKSKAQKLLGLSGKQLGELAANQTILSRPTARAIEVYTGVLYENLRFDELEKPAQNWIQKRVFISSALYGIVGAFDKIASYRLSGDKSLPKVGAIKNYWLDFSKELLDKHFKNNLVLDLRSGIYAAFWQPPTEMGDKFVVGKVVQKVKLNGKTTYKVVSHHNKATKGKLVAALARAKANPKNARELVEVLKKLGFEVKLETKQKNKPYTLIIVMP